MYCISNLSLVTFADVVLCCCFGVLVPTSLKRAAEVREDGAESAGSFTHKPWSVCLSTHLFQENILSMAHSWFIYSKAGSIVAVLLKTHRRSRSRDKKHWAGKAQETDRQTWGQLGRGERQGLKISLIFMIGVSNWWIVILIGWFC